MRFLDWIFGSPETDHSEAEEAIKRAQRDLEQARDRSHEVERLSRALRLRRTHNHFAEQIRKSMGIPNE